MINKSNGKFDYSKLKGRIIEICGTLSEFGRQMGISNSTVTAKIAGNSDFTQDEIYKAVKILKLSESDISLYFFTLSV